MIIKDENAKDYWCPYGRVLSERAAASSHNRYGNDIPVTMCLGPRCAKWERHEDFGFGMGYCGA